MKIITDYKDYYDHGMVFGIDEGIVYERFQKEIHPPKYIENKHGGILGFCNEFWEVKKVDVRDVENRYWHYKNRGKPTYEEEKEVLIKNGWIEGSPEYEVGSKDEVAYYFWLRPVENITNMEWNASRWRPRDYTHYNNWLKSIFSEHMVPSFFVAEDKSYTTTLNPVLMEIGLQKIMDSVEAFQKLSTFIPSLKPEDTFEMTNEEKGRSKGFDEFSFRNKNTKNKPKKF